jgi:hypothetical protein
LHHKKKQEQQKGILGCKRAVFWAKTQFPTQFSTGAGKFHSATSINITSEIEADFSIKGIAIDPYHQGGGEKLWEVLLKVVESWIFGPVSSRLR